MGAGLIASAVITNCSKNVEGTVITPINPAAEFPVPEEQEQIPAFTKAEYTDINIPTYSELTDENAILDAQKTALYKLHAQNKSIDGLPVRCYDRSFLNAVITGAAKRADKTFSFYADALKTAKYDLAREHGVMDENTLFQIKMDLMIKVTDIADMEEKKYGKGADGINDLLYRISYMGEKQLYEIIDLLEKRLPNAFAPQDRQYGEDIAHQISNLSEYHGWLDGMKQYGVTPAIPHSFYENLETDLTETGTAKGLELLAGK